MNKRGIAMQTLVIAILALVVLVILIFVFRTQIGGLKERYTNIAEKSEQRAGEGGCGGLFSGTQCVEGACTSLDTDTVKWVTESSLTCPGTKTCCKKK